MLFKDSENWGQMSVGGSVNESNPQTCNLYVGLTSLSIPIGREWHTAVVLHQSFQNREQKLHQHGDN